MITAVIDAGQHYCQAVSDLWQWDYGQTLRIQGVKIPAAVEVQFSTTERIGETVTRIGVTKEGVTEVPIPDTLLEGGGTTQDYTIYAFVYIENGDFGKTEYRVSMKVRARPKPEAHATPEEGELFRQAIVAVAESADRAESARKSAEASADEAKTSKENAETAAKVAEAFKTEAETARSEAVRAATGSTDAKDSAEKSRAAAEKAKQDAEAAKAAADADKEAAEAAQAKAEAAQKAAENAETEAKKAQTATETAKRETETAKNDAAQAKEAAEKAKIGTAADRETAETASKVAQISATSAEKSAKKAEAAKEEIQESAEQIQKNATEIDSIKENKIEKPADLPIVGKILRVKSVNEDGTFICEWADSGGSNLDVRINGESIVQNGTAEIPLCTKTKEAGLISIDTYTSNGGLHRANNETGLIRIASATNNQIDERRNKFCPIVPETIDYAVKAAMCDGKGAMWTADEQTAARERMGAWTGDWQIIMDETLAELTQEVSFEVPDDTKEMICYFKSGAAPKNAQVYLRTSNNGSSIAESFTSFGGSLSNNTISIGCQKIQFLNSQYGLIEYSYLSHSTPSSADYVQRAGKPSLLRIDSKRFAFHSVDINGGYPVETRLLVLVRR
ncbi:MAG TPA: hypothetical protein DIV51_01755 [Lachnospiraceae bacterium]|nr:hypothetical protein [Lachnospiraceae bacterium]